MENKEKKTEYIFILISSIYDKLLILIMIILKVILLNLIFNIIEKN